MSKKDIKLRVKESSEKLEKLVIQYQFKKVAVTKHNKLSLEIMLNVKLKKSLNI